MPIKCKFGDIDKLSRLVQALGHHNPSDKGPMLKLALAEDLQIVDKFRVSRLIKGIDAQLAIYGKSIVALAKKYGDPVKANNIESYQIKPENMAKYQAEKAAIDAEECEIDANLLPTTSYDIPAITANDLNLLEPFIVPLVENAETKPKG